MSCLKFQKLIVLVHEQKLNEKQHNQLKEHLAVCINCRNELKKNDRYFTALDKIKKMEIKENENASENILQAVRRDQNFNQSFIFDNFERINNFLSQRGVRLAFTVIIVFLISVFAVQEILVLNKISALEKRMTQQNPINPQQQFQKYEQLIATVKEQLLNEQEQDNELIVDRKMLETLFLEYGKLEIKNQMLIDYLSKHHPEAAVLFKDKPSEIQKLLNDHKALKKLIHEL